MSKKARAAAVCLTAIIMLSTIMLSNATVYGAESVSGTDIKEFSEAVNLKEDSWIYSTKKDSSGEVYAIITKYSGFDRELAIPSRLGGYTVKKIGSEAMSGCKYLVSVELSDGITDIGRYAFKDCVGISKVKLSAALETIGDGAFYNCSSLKAVTGADKVKKIGRYAFANCWHLNSIKLSADLEEIGDGAFLSCESLKSVKLGDSLKSLGMSAFKNCILLSSIKLPDGLTQLGNGAFYGCTSLKEAVIGASLKSIPASAFYGCESLESVSFGGNVESIGGSAFEGCSALTRADIPDSAVSIGALAFYNCSALKEAVLGKKMKSIGMGAFNGCQTLKEISVNDGNAVFASKGGLLYSKDLKRVILCPRGFSGKLDIADAAEEISKYAFAGCHNATAVRLPATLTKIGAGAFFDCYNITEYAMPTALNEVGASSIGGYMRGGRLKNEPYLKVYGSAEGTLKDYCTKAKLNYASYDNTLNAGCENIVLEQGKSFTIPAAFMTAQKSTLEWISNDTSVAVVDKKGTVTANEIGSTEIILSADGFNSVEIKLEVIPVQSSQQANDFVTHEEKSVFAGDSFELSSLFDIIIDPLIDQKKYWYSSNPSVARVNGEGHVTTIKSGKAVITCVSYERASESCTVNVSDKPVQITIKNEAAELAIGKRIHLSAEVMPKKADSHVTWKSNNEDIAAVDSNGYVTAISQGSCNITAVSDNGIEASITVNCYIPMESMSLKTTEHSMYKGKTFNLETERTPADSKQRIVWTSSDNRVATVNSKGKVTGVSFGTAIICASTEDGLVAECQINILAKAEKLNIDSKKLLLNIDDIHKLNAIILPSYSPETTEKCEWNSTDTSIAEIDEDGVVTAKGEGSCIINCKIKDELISKCRVTVRKPAELAEITAPKTEIYIGEVMVLKAKLTPEDSTDSIEWKSSNPEVAYVTSTGSIKAKASGTAVITLTVTNDVTGNKLCVEQEIAVLSAAEGIKLSSSNISMQIGAADSLTYTLTPSDSNDVIVWYSSDDSIASVRSDGLIRGISAGSCYIYAETGSGKSARCKVNVLND